MSNFDSDDRSRAAASASDPANVPPPAAAPPIPPVVARPWTVPEVSSEGIHFLAEQSAAPSPTRVGHPIIAWVVILALVSLIVKPRPVDPGQAPGKSSSQATLASKFMEIQAKYLVGASQFPPLSGKDLYEHAEPLNTGPLESRYRYVVLTGELAGAKQARKQLDKIQQRVVETGAETTRQQQQIQHVLNQLYADYARNRWDAPSLGPEQRALLKSELDWFGALALAPKEGANVEQRRAVIAPARRTVVVLVPAMLMMFLVGAAGLVGLTVFVAQTASGRIRPALLAGSRHGAIYAETFAVWMLLFLLMEIAASELVGEDNILTVNLAVFFLSLLALGWPVVRGIPWRRVRRDIGLTLGKHPFWEPVWGVICYASTLPLLIIGLVIMLLLMSVAGLFTFGQAGEGGADEFAAGELPSHPVIQWISEAGLAGRVMIVLLACVAAPIVEETVFRGVLYRHLRDSTAAWRVGFSVLFSAGLASFLFAVIHPQGIFAVPALMSLAIGFSLAREWRGSLIAPMTMHAVNNSLVTLLMFAII